MRLLKASILAVAVVALTAPAYAGAGSSSLGGCGGYSQSARIAQTVVTPNGGPQTVVVQTAEQKK